MTAVSGRRMAETVARRGGITVIPQDIPMPVVADVVSWVKERHLVFDTPITLDPHQTVGDAIALLPKRSHRAAFVVEDGRPVGVVTEEDCTGVDRFTQVHEVMTANPVTLPDTVDPREAFERLDEARRRVAPVVDADGRLRRRADPHRPRCAPPSTPRPSTPPGRLRVAAAVGVNGDVAAKARGAASTPAPTARGRHRARPPGPDDRGAARRPDARPGGPGRGRQRGLRRGRARAGRRPGPTSSRSVSDRARCAPRG